MTAPTFKDYFSSAAAEYATFRPRYPAALFDFVASLPAARANAWDCATGNGQAVGTAREALRTRRRNGREPRADRARDAAPARVVRGRARGCEWARRGLGRSRDRRAGASLVSARAASLPRSRRVLAPGGALAVWCYTRPELSGAIDEIVDRFHSVTCRHTGRRIANSSTMVSHYRHAVRRCCLRRALGIEAQLTLDQFAGYLRTWSAARNLAAAMGSIR